MKRTTLLITLIIGAFICQSTAFAKTHTFQHILDDTGRQFNPGDFIIMNLSGQEVFEVNMDCKGYRGSRATLYIDGHEYETKRLHHWRDTYTWTFPSKHARKVEIYFSAVDPIVYSTSVQYEADFEIKIQTVIETVEVAQKQVAFKAKHLLAMIDNLFSRVEGNPAVEGFVDESAILAEELVFYADKSLDSDASQFTNKNAIALIQTLDCPKSRRILRKIQKFTRKNRRLVREIRAEMTKLREMTDYFQLECSAFTKAWH